VGRPVPAPVFEISTGLSLTVIIGVPVGTVVASLISPAGRAQTAIANVRRQAQNYLDLGDTGYRAQRNRVFEALVDEEEQIRALGPSPLRIASTPAPRCHRRYGLAPPGLA
jgi:tellurite resistance protein TerC